MLVAELICTTGKSLSALMTERMAAYPCSREINYTVTNAKAAMDKVQAYFASFEPKIDVTDGVSLDSILGV